MKGRVYDPIIARFMSADPIIQSPFRSQSFNRYSYVWNNPLNATDPTGLCTVTGSRINYDVCYDSQGNETLESKQEALRENGQRESEGALPSAQLADAANKSAQRSDSSPLETAELTARKTRAERHDRREARRTQASTNSVTVLPDIVGDPNIDAAAVIQLDALPASNKEQAFELIGTDEYALILSNEPESGTETTSPVQRVPGIVAIAHSHVPSRDSDLAARRATTAARELPGPGDHVPLVRFGVPVYVLTPQRHVRVLEHVGGQDIVRTVRGQDAPGQSTWKRGVCDARGNCEFR
jgi:hypothetical protein